MKYFYKITALILACSLFFISNDAIAQVSMSTTGNYTQDFNTLISSGTATWVNNSTITNWYAQRSGSGTGIAANDGGATAGNLYSYGSTSSSDRSLGSLGSGNSAAGHFAYGVLLTNASSSTITDISVSYTLEQWRNNAAPTQTVKFYYKIQSSPITDLNPNSATGWTAVTALDATSPITGGTAGPLNGNLPANKVVISNISIPSLSLAAGQYIMLKWDDPDHTGSDHGLSIDDVTISWTVPTAGTPTLLVTPTSLTGLDYVSGNGPSTAQTIAVSGSSLDGTDVTVSAPTNFEISLDGTTYSSTLSLPTYTGTSTNIYVRLAAGLSGGSYTGDVSISGGGVATPTTVSVSGNVTCAIPTYGSDPTNQIVNTGDAFSFTATSYTNATTLQWQDSVAGGVWTDISGANSISYSGTASSALNNHYYRLKLVNNCGTSSIITIYTMEAILSVNSTCTAPTYTTVTDQSVTMPATATFSTSATDATNYQWQLSTDNGTSWNDITGATMTSYTTSATSMTMNGYQYRLLLTNSCGSSLADTTVNSNAATLTVIDPSVPVIESIWSNPITGSNPNTANPYTIGDINNANITVSGIGRGSGIDGSSASNRYNANNWSVTTIDLDDYFYFTLTPNAGYEIDFTTFYYSSQASSSGPTHFEVRSSVDGYTSIMTSPSEAGVTLSLSGSQFQNITDPITFRVYGYNATAAGGTFSINDFDFQGSVVPISLISTIDITSLSDDNFCNNVSNTFDINFNTSGFTGVQTFTAELSDSSGSFSSPTNIGSVSTSTTPATISATIPANTLMTDGTNYKIRITNGTTISDTTATLTVNTPADGTIVPVDPFVCNGEASEVIFSTTSLNGPFTIYIGSTSPGTSFTGVNNNDEIEVSNTTTPGTTDYILYRIIDVNGCETPNP